MRFVSLSLAAFAVIRIEIVSFSATPQRGDRGYQSGLHFLSAPDVSSMS
jgi:hypothetical protein